MWELEDAEASRYRREQEEKRRKARDFGSQVEPAPAIRSAAPDFDPSEGTRTVDINGKPLIGIDAVGAFPIGP